MPGLTCYRRRGSPFGAAVPAAMTLSIATDHCGFAKAFGLEHALILRPIVTQDANRDQQRMEPA